MMPDGAQHGGEPQLSSQSWQVKKKSIYTVYAIEQNVKQQNTAMSVSMTKNIQCHMAGKIRRDTVA